MTEARVAGLSGGAGPVCPGTVDAARYVRAVRGVGVGSQLALELLEGRRRGDIVVPFWVRDDGGGREICPNKSEARAGDYVRDEPG